MTDLITSENMIIGAGLLDGEQAKALIGRLRPEDFSVEANREIYEAFCQIDANGEEIDAAKVANLSGVSRDYLFQLLEIAPTRADIEPHIAEVKKASMRRCIRAAMEQINADILANDDPSEIIDRAVRDLQEIGQGNGGEVVTGEQMALEFWRRLDGEGFSVPTGLHDLDRVLGGGMLNSGFYVLAARPGCGKTALALQIADNVAREGSVLFVSLEMDTVQLTARRVSRICRIPATKLLMGGATDAEIAQAASAGRRLINIPLYLNKALRCTVSEIRAMSRQVDNLRMIVIDYLGLIKPNMRLKSRYEQITEISGELKILARTMGVPVLCLAQLNRASEQRGDKKPMLADLRDSGAIEQDADAVIFLHRPDMYDDEDKNDWVQVDVCVAKNRHAGTGDVKMMLHLASGEFREIENRYG